MICSYSGKRLINSDVVPSVFTACVNCQIYVTIYNIIYRLQYLTLIESEMAMGLTFIVYLQKKAYLHV